jgi:cell division protein FtsI (penicillin-binding protein 3)
VNVGMAMLALSLEPRQIWTTLSSLGFGQVTTSGFPGESAGLLSGYAHWRNITIATLSHGYRLSVTPLQLAQALCDAGRMASAGRCRWGSIRRCGQRVLVEPVARSLIAPARVGRESRRYRAAGAHPGLSRLGQNRHGAEGRLELCDRSSRRHLRRRRAGHQSATRRGGGDRRAERRQVLRWRVSAPVFAAVLGGALRLMGIPPDDAGAAAGNDARASQRVAQR